MAAYLFPTSVCTGPFQMFPAWLPHTPHTPHPQTPTPNLDSLTGAKVPARSTRLSSARLLAAPPLVLRPIGSRQMCLRKADSGSVTGGSIIAHMQLFVSGRGRLFLMRGKCLALLFIFFPPPPASSATVQRTLCNVTSGRSSDSPSSVTIGGPVLVGRPGST